MALTTVKTGRYVEATYANVKETFPESAAKLAGTLSTGSRKDKIVGVDTTFKSELTKGDFIWFTTTDEVFEVENVKSDTELTLKRELSGALSGVAYRTIKRSSFKKVRVTSATAGAKVNTIALVANYEHTYGTTQDNGEGGGNRMSPILIDSTPGGGSTIYVYAE